MARKRRRGWYATGAAGLGLLLWFLLAGGGEEGAPAPVEGRGGGEPAADVAGKGGTGGARDGAAEPSPGASGLTPPSRPEPSSGVPGPGVPAPREPAGAEAQGPDRSLADRVYGALALVARHAAEARLGQAWAALDAVAEEPADAALQARLEAARSSLREAQQERVQELGQLVHEGRILAARAQLVRMTTPLDGRVVAAIGELAASRGWPALTPGAGSGAAAREPGAVAPAAAAPLPRDRMVRLRQEDREVTGRLVRAEGERVTVRLETAQGVLFPVVPRTDVEPLEATPAEALAQASAAEAHGDPLTAALWHAYAMAREPRGAPASGGR